MVRSYLSIKDEEIDARQKEVVEKNKRIIEEYEKLSFWDKYIFGKGINLHQQITENWLSFMNWMDNHIKEMENKR